MSFRTVWPPNADHRVTVRATGAQMVSWSIAARQLGNRPLPAFLAFAADLAVDHFAEMLRSAQRAERRREKRRQARKAKQQPEEK